MSGNNLAARSVLWPFARVPAWYWGVVRDDSPAVLHVAGILGAAMAGLGVVVDQLHLHGPRAGYALALRLLSVAYFAGLMALARRRPALAARWYETIVASMLLFVAFVYAVIGAWVPGGFANLYFMAVFEAELAAFTFLPVRLRTLLPVLVATAAIFVLTGVYVGGEPLDETGVNLVFSFAFFGAIGLAAQSAVLGVRFRAYLAQRQVNDALAAEGQRLEAAVAARTAALEEALEGLRRQSEAQRKVERALAQQTKLAALGRLTAGIVHDFGNVLLAVRGSAQLAQGRGGDPALEAGLETVIEAADQGNLLVRRLLDFARIGPRRAARVAARPLFFEAAAFAAKAVVGRVVVEPSYAGDADAQIEVDPLQLKQVLLNLVVNAADASPRGARVAVRCVAEAEALRVEVVDEGAGMDEDVQARIFEPFFTTKGEQGTGLGLAQVYGLVQQNGGRLEVQSAPGRGTTVTLRFPRARVAEGGGPARRLLVVDDDAGVRGVIAAMAGALGHVAVEAGSAGEALDLLEARGPFDAVLTDLRMPGDDAGALARELRRRAPGMRIACLTALTPVDAGGEFDWVGPKPCGTDELAAVLARLFAA